MSLEFAIRDDDCNYFTDPAELEAVYADLPDDIPVSYAVVPYHIATKSDAVPEEHWNEDGEHPLEANEKLVEYLRTGLDEERLSVALHGCTHERIDGQPEFVSAPDPRERISRGREQLESALGRDVDVFVPPNNSMSRPSIQRVKGAGMRLCYYPTPIDRPKTPEVFRVFLRDLWFKYRNKAEGPSRSSATPINSSDREITRCSCRFDRSPTNSREAPKSPASH